MRSNEENSVSRRQFIRNSGMLACASMLGGKTASAMSIFKKKIPIGVQLYSVREECKNNFPKVLAAISEMGYDGVEFAGYHDRTAKEIRTLLDDNGLKACGTHTAMDTLMADNFQSTVDYNKELGNEYLIVPWLSEAEHKTKQAWLKRAALFNEIEEKARKQGMRVGYHNHMFEFTPINGELPWDIFFGNTNDNVIMQFDTGNALQGGGDPLPFLKNYPGRAVTVHVKEYSASNPKALVGEGDIDWKQLFDVCETVGGTKWYIVEQEKYPYPPLESIKRCLDNLREMGK